MAQQQELPDLDRLPRAPRLALAYAPAAIRDMIATVMLLDVQFDGFVRNASEPVLAQMRLAWWRDRFAQDPSDWPKGNPLLSNFRDLGGHAGKLAHVVDGWERLLGERPLGPEDVLAHAEGRAQGWVALAAHVGESAALPAVARAGKRWALLDLAWSHAEATERSMALKLAGSIAPTAALPRNLRALGVLDGLVQRALRHDRPPLSRASDMTTALRIGLFGR